MKIGKAVSVRNVIQLNKDLQAYPYNKKRFVNMYGSLYLLDEKREMWENWYDNPK